MKYPSKLRWEREEPDHLVPEFLGGEAGADSGPTIADAMLAAQQELAESPQDEADGSDDETAPAGGLTRCSRGITFF